MKVRTKSKYIFDPCWVDREALRPVNATAGDIVRVVRPPGAPKTNAFSHCYIETLDGTFLGSVCTDSLYKIPTIPPDNSSLSY